MVLQLLFLTLHLTLCFLLSSCPLLSLHLLLPPLLLPPLPSSLFLPPPLWTLLLHPLPQSRLLLCQPQSLPSSSLQSVS